MSTIGGQIVTPADPAAITEQINNFNRQPFRELLASALGTKPTYKALKAFADKYPDRWSQYLSTIARLAGFSDKVEVDVKGLIAVANLSHAELLDLRSRLLEQLEQQQSTDVTPQSGGNSGGSKPDNE